MGGSGLAIPTLHQVSVLACSACLQQYAWAEGGTDAMVCADMLHACMALLLSCRVGFNSVYHVTDLPGFVSGEHLVFFDPHCKYLPSISAANPGKKINFVAHPVNSKLADQVAPFHFFGCDTRQAFSGTLFRFPLRTQQQADASTISKQVGQRSRLGFQQNRVWSMAAVC